MWNVSGTTVEGGPADVPFVEIEHLASREQVLVAAGGLFEENEASSYVQK
jgi:acetyl-CoA acetyltransferase